MDAVDDHLDAKFLVCAGRGTSRDAIVQASLPRRRPRATTTTPRRAPVRRLPGRSSLGAEACSTPCRCWSGCERRRRPGARPLRPVAGCARAVASDGRHRVAAIITDHASAEYDVDVDDWTWRRTGADVVVMPNVTLKRTTTRSRTTPRPAPASAKLGGHRPHGCPDAAAAGLPETCTSGTCPTSRATRPRTGRSWLASRRSVSTCTGWPRTSTPVTCWPAPRCR